MFRFFSISAAVVLASHVQAQPPDPKKAIETKPVASFTGHQASISSILFTKDGSGIISACAKDVRNWDVATGKEQGAAQRLGNRVVALSADGKRLASVDRDDVVIADLASSKKLVSFDPQIKANGRFPFRSRVAAMAFSPDGKLLATAGSSERVGGRHGLPGGNVTLWDVATGQIVHRFDTLGTSASSVVFSADGSKVAAGTAGAGGELPAPAEAWIWDVAKGELIRAIASQEKSNYGQLVSISDIALSSDGKQLAMAVGTGGRGQPAGLITGDGSSSIRIFEVMSGKAVTELPGHTTRISRILYGSEGTIISAGYDRAIHIWNVKSGKANRSMAVPLNAVEALALSADHKRMAAGADTGDILVWELPK